MEGEFEDSLRELGPETRARYRFKVVRDDAPFALLSFDLVEVGPGSIELVQPSSRGYEWYYIATALAVVLVAIPLAVGILPWQILLGAPAGMSTAANETAILYFLCVLGAVAAGSRYLPRLAEHQPRTRVALTVAGVELSQSAKSPSRLHVQSGSEDIWLTVYGRPDDVDGALRLSGQTIYQVLPQQPRGIRRRGRRNVTKPL